MCIVTHMVRVQCLDTLVLMDVLYNLTHEGHHVIVGVLLIIVNNYKKYEKQRFFYKTIGSVGGLRTLSYTRHKVCHC